VSAALAQVRFQVVCFLVAVVVLVVSRTRIIAPCENLLRRVQAHSADGAVVAQSVLGLWSVVAGKDDGDVFVTIEGRAGRIHTATKPAHRVTNYRSLRRNHDRGSGRSRQSGIGIHDHGERRRGNDGIGNSVDHLPVD
jgi:hypothetical protein